MHQGLSPQAAARAELWRRVKERGVAFIGWFVDWDDTIPFHYIWSDLDTRHCTKWKWKRRWAGWVTCRVWGHPKWYRDHCGRPEHDRCAACDNRRDRIEEGAKRWVRRMFVR